MKGSFFMLIKVILCIYKGKYIMKKQSNIIIRVDEEVKNSFQKLVEDNKTTMSFVLNETIIEMINKQSIPPRIRGRINIEVARKENTLTIIQIKHLLEEIVEEANLKNKIKKAYLFGSYSRGEETEKSDIDLRIEVENRFNLFDLSEMSSLLKQKTGKKVDIATQKPADMDPEFYTSIRKDEICIYERA